jgi:hypothetical protein
MFSIDQDSCKDKCTKFYHTLMYDYQQANDLDTKMVSNEKEEDNIDDILNELEVSFSSSNDESIEVTTYEEPKIINYRVPLFKIPPARAKVLVLDW